MTALPDDLGALVLALVLVLAVTLARMGRLPSRWNQSTQKAEARAKGVLRELLSKDELHHLDRFGCLMVPSPGIPERTYCIPAHPGMVAVYESGRLAMRLCLQPVEPLPASDVILMLKLMIEGNEDQYLRVANVQPVTSPFR